MSSLDQHGNPMSRRRRRRRSYERATDALLRYSPAVIDGTTELVERAPAGADGPRPHGVPLPDEHRRTRRRHRQGRLVGAWAALPMNDREQAHHDAIGAWVGGDWRRRQRRARRTAPAVAHRPARAPDRAPARLLPRRRGATSAIARAGRCRSSTPPIRTTAFVRGMQAFGLEESGDYGAAEAAGLAAVAAQPRRRVGDPCRRPRATRCRAGSTRASSFLSTRRDDWGAATCSRVHNWWHLALYLLEAGDVDEALAIYDAEVHNADSAGVPLEMLDAERAAVAPLPRRPRHGRSVRARSPTRGRPAAGDRVVVRVQRPARGHGARRRRADRRRPSSTSSDLAGYVHRDGAGTNVAMATEIGLPASRAVLRFAQGRHDDVIAELPPIRRALPALRRLARPARRAAAHAARVGAPSGSARPGPGAAWPSGSASANRACTAGPNRPASSGTAGQMARRWRPSGRQRPTAAASRPSRSATRPPERSSSRAPGRRRGCSTWPAPTPRRRRR